ncbi:NepR family anti-sigma factor [Pseudoprimorskyibacter insulae]|uniref:Anti-sigma factor NepR domain-containing protein n=1 Tax=Pseudoprimorskyibacter insulae TaxID=1695997 RepID=A0A2R8AU39_9RHOB|nr:NepR family anti-sigma factor [Pseudoprimorskyibacter insulae]SPF79563.1 hypothetical protein PRI8871_01359 [Pseudoprimorskyibacter insulae]
MDNSNRRSRLERQIDENLRKVYHNEEEDAPVPDRFLDLLAQLKEQDIAGDTENDA